MSVSVLFRPAAERDAEHALDWYAVHAPHQVVRFVDDLAAAVESIRESPRAFRILRGDARRASLRLFPYSIWYRIDDSHDVIEVLAVVHTRQDAGRLRSRLD